MVIWHGNDMTHTAVHVMSYVGLTLAYYPFKKPNFRLLRAKVIKIQISASAPRLYLYMHPNYCIPLFKGVCIPRDLTLNILVIGHI